MSTEQPDPSDMPRDELEEELSERREQADEIAEIKKTQEIIFETVTELETAITGDDGSWAASQLAKQGESMLDRIEKLEQGSSSGAIDPETRKKLLPIHRELFKVRDDDPDQVTGNKRRAVELFRMMLRKAAESDKKTFGVTQSGDRSTDNHTWEISRDGAEHIIEFAHTMPQDGKSKTIRRAMIQAQKLSKRGTCDCADSEECDHGLLNFSKPDSYVLTAPVTDFHRYLEMVEEWLTDGVSAPTPADDDGEQPSEASPVQEDEIEDEFDRLDAAHPDPADGVVSSSDESVSARGDEHTG